METSLPNKPNPCNPFDPLDVDDDSPTGWRMGPLWRSEGYGEESFQMGRDDSFASKDMDVQPMHSQM